MLKLQPCLFVMVNLLHDSMFWVNIFKLDSTDKGPFAWGTPFQAVSFQLYDTILSKGWLVGWVGLDCVGSPK